MRSRRSRGSPGRGARASRGGENSCSAEGSGVWGLGDKAHVAGGRSGGLRTVRVAVRADAERSRSERAIRLTARHAGADQRVRAEPPSRAREVRRAPGGFARRKEDDDWGVVETTARVETTTREPAPGPAADGRSRGVVRVAIPIANDSALAPP